VQGNTDDHPARHILARLQLLANGFDPCKSIDGNATMMTKLFLPCLLLILLVGNATGSMLAGESVEAVILSTIENSTVFSNLRSRILTSTTVTTSDCSAIRTDPFPAELQLFYEYSVEFKAGRAVSLSDLERAIASAVAIQLNICDTAGRPAFKIRTDFPHRFSDSSKFKSAIARDCGIQNIYGSHLIVSMFY
jgi:hypothetical protein